MTTANYQFRYLWMVLSILSTCTFSLEIIHMSTLNDSQYSTVERVAFQLNAITIAGGVIKYKKKNLVYNSLCGEFPRAEFAKDKTGNGALLTRYQSEDTDEKDKWDVRITNAEKFKEYNENQNKSANQEMISANLYYYGLLLYSEEDVSQPKSYYITSLYQTGGVKILKEMLEDDQGFFKYMANPYNRILFYLDLVRIWKTVAVTMKMRICVGSPSNITVRVPDGDNPIYRPIFRHPEWAVGLGQKCEDYAPNYSSKSVITGKIESSETYQMTIETFTLGRIIYFIEIMMAHQSYEKMSMDTSILDEMSAREAMIYEDRVTTEDKYSNASLFEAHEIYRNMIKGYREENPIQNENVNTALKSMYEGLFDLLDTMVRENNVMNGRPNWDNVGKSFTNLLGIVSPYFHQQRRLLLI